MAAGEYVSVSSQSDVERADRQTEMGHLAADPAGELEELTEIYQTRAFHANWPSRWRLPYTRTTLLRPTCATSSGIMNRPERDRCRLLVRRKFASLSAALFLSSACSLRTRNPEWP